MFLGIDISDWINILLLTVTLVTVNYARTSLLMEYSSRIHVIKYKKKLYWKDDSQLILEIETDIESKGNGYALKLFMLVSDQKKKFSFFRNYFLSKPLINIRSNDIKKTNIELSKKDWDKSKNRFEHMKLYIVYQDEMGNIFSIKPNYHNDNKHLDSFSELPKRMTITHPRYWLFKFRFFLARKQGNTSVSKVNELARLQSKVNKNSK